jgi:hypothetical protein
MEVVVEPGLRRRGLTLAFLMERHNLFAHSNVFAAPDP